MRDYDISIMKNNIKAIMKEKNIRQTQLAAATGIPQPQISSVLNTQNSKSFTVVQLVAIATFFDCSADELLGLNPKEKSRQIESISDILNIIFELDANQENGLNIGKCETGKKEHIFDDNYEDIKTTGFYFDIPVMKTILNEWNDLKNTNVEDTLKEKILNLWKGDALTKYSGYKREWGFRNELEWGRCLAELFLQNTGCDRVIDDDLLSEDPADEHNFPILKNYIENNLNDDDFFSDGEREIIERCFFVLGTTVHEELPPGFF